MYKKAPLLQFVKRPTDAISPSQLKLGLADRIAFAKGPGAVAAVAAKLARTGISTPWTTVKGVNKSLAQAARTAQSTLTRGASEIAGGLGNLAKRFKLW